MIPGFSLSDHAKHMIDVRSINETWVDAALSKPDKAISESDGTRHYLKAISEYDGKVLRVVVNEDTSPKIVVTLFFDRRVKDL